MRRFTIVAVGGIAWGFLALAQAGSTGEAAPKNWEPFRTELLKSGAESHYPTDPNTGIKGSYTTRVTLGELAGKSRVSAMCVFSFWDFNNAALCGTGKVKFKAKIGGQQVFKGKVDKFSKDYCDTQAWYAMDVDLSAFAATDELVCTARVSDRAKLPQGANSGIRYEATVEEIVRYTRGSN